MKKRIATPDAFRSRTPKAGSCTLRPVPGGFSAIIGNIRSDNHPGTGVLAWHYHFAVLKLPGKRNVISSPKAKRRMKSSRSWQNTSRRSTACMELPNPSKTFFAGRSVGNRDDGRLEAVRLFPT